MSEKKQFERRALELFKEKWETFPPGQILETESPDFVVTFNGRTIGIEITRYFRPPEPNRRPMQEQESLARRIVELAKQEFEAAYDIPLRVDVEFNECEGLENAEIRKIAQDIAEVVRNHVPPINEGCVVRVARDYWDRYSPKLDYIVVHQFSVLTRGDWDAGQWGWIPRVRTEELQGIIDRKSALLPTFNSECAAHWLVIVINSSEISTHADLTSEVLSHRFRSGFDEVFVMQHFTGSVHQLLRA